MCVPSTPMTTTTPTETNEVRVNLKSIFRSVEVCLIPNRIVFPSGKCLREKFHAEYVFHVNRSYLFTFKLKKRCSKMWTYMWPIYVRHIAHLQAFDPTIFIIVSQSILSEDNAKWFPNSVFQTNMFTVDSHSVLCYVKHTKRGVRFYYFPFYSTRKALYFWMSEPKFRSNGKIGKFRSVNYVFFT